MSWFSNFAKSAAKNTAETTTQAAAMSVEQELEKLRDKKLLPGQLSAVRRIHDISGEILASQG